ncbi:hypothetical protein TNCV_950511 [Trichonephila clavipes]|nr:hypothetical protein TNCV_950511 [Trichonephila clavipes]
MRQSKFLKIFQFFAVLTVAKAFGSFGGPPANVQGAEDYDKHLYPCYTSINCIYKGTDEHKRIEECVGNMDKQDIQIGLNFYNPDLKSQDYTDVYDVIDQVYCKANTTERKKMFKLVTAGAIQVNGMGCEKRHSKSSCAHFDHFVECLLDLLEALNNEEKCDIEEFEKKASGG